jgi:hypothetical protein
MTAERSFSPQRKSYCLDLMSSSDLMRFSANFQKAGVELQPVRRSDYGEQCPSFSRRFARPTIIHGMSPQFEDAFL